MRTSCVCFDARRAGTGFTHRAPCARDAGNAIFGGKGRPEGARSSRTPSTTKRGTRSFLVPYIIGIVELPEQTGLRLTTNIVNCAIDDVQIGMALRVTFEQQGEFFLPLFEPATGLIVGVRQLRQLLSGIRVVELADGIAGQLLRQAVRRSRCRRREGGNSRRRSPAPPRRCPARARWPVPRWRVPARQHEQARDRHRSGERARPCTPCAPARAVAIGDRGRGSRRFAVECVGDQLGRDPRAIARNLGGAHQRLRRDGSVRRVSMERSRCPGRERSLAHARAHRSRSPAPARPRGAVPGRQHGGARCARGRGDRPNRVARARSSTARPSRRWPRLPTRLTTLLAYHYRGRQPGADPWRLASTETLIPTGVFPCRDGYMAMMSTPQQLAEMLEVLDDDNLRAAFAQTGRLRAGRDQGGDGCGALPLAVRSDPRRGNGRGPAVGLAARGGELARRGSRRRSSPSAGVLGPRRRPGCRARSICPEPPAGLRKEGGRCAGSLRSSRSTTPRSTPNSRHRVGAEPVGRGAGADRRSTPTGAGGDPGPRHDRGVVRAVRHDAPGRPGRRSDPGGEPLGAATHDQGLPGPPHNLEPRIPGIALRPGCSRAARSAVEPPRDEQLVGAEQALLHHRRASSRRPRAADATGRALGRVHRQLQSRRARQDRHLGQRAPRPQSSARSSCACRRREQRATGRATRDSASSSTG